MFDANKPIDEFTWIKTASYEELNRMAGIIGNELMNDSELSTIGGIEELDIIKNEIEKRQINGECA